MTKNEKRTVNSQRAEVLRSAFEAMTRGSLPGFAVSMTSPEASTGGGVRARQHIVLTTAEGLAVVVGWANAAEKTAELRTLGYVLSICKQRFGTELAIPRAEYVAFLELATRLLSDEGMTVQAAAFARAEGGAGGSGRAKALAGQW
jgi:hypothetical protein